MAKLPTIEQFAKQVSDLALDEFEYEGKTIREWTELILNGNLTEIVRCRDCKFRSSWMMNRNLRYICPESGMFPNGENDFCSYGKRKGGSDNG